MEHSWVMEYTTLRQCSCTRMKLLIMAKRTATTYQLLLLGLEKQAKLASSAILLVRFFNFVKMTLVNLTKTKSRSYNSWL